MPWLMVWALTLSDMKCGGGVSSLDGGGGEIDVLHGSRVRHLSTLQSH